MKRSFLFAVLLTAGLLLVQYKISAQVGIGTVIPDVSSLLDVTSSTKGFLVPRMSLAQRNAITNPATGLVIFQIDNNPGLYYNSGTQGFPVWALVGNNAGPWQANGSSIYFSSGNVGIGTIWPAAQLHSYGMGIGEGNVVFVGQWKSPAGSPPVTGNGTRMMWYPDKAAFRAGHVTGVQWDASNVGEYSLAVGFSNIASGDGSMAAGLSNTASGVNSLATGGSSIASGNYSVALGYAAASSGFNSFAEGNAATASGSFSVAMGYTLTAPSYCETVIGYRNTPYTPVGTVSWNLSDRLFVVANGFSSPSNALTILKNGNIGVGIDNPTALFHTYGTGTGKGNVVFVGEYQPTSPGAPPVTGAGTRMMWYPDKAAFRAGYSAGAQWDAVNVGNYSIATGYSPTASGNYSHAMGYYATASGEYSFALGRNCDAGGDYSNAIGYNCDANGQHSTAIGNVSQAVGDYSLALGYFASADAYESTVIGTNNVGGGNATNWVDTDPLFEVGNGSGLYPNNALTVLKNGNVGIDEANPDYRLVINAPGTSSTGIVTCRNSTGETKVVLRQNSNGCGAINVYKTGDVNSISIIGDGDSYFNGGDLGIGTSSPAYKLQVGVAGDGTQARANAWNLLSDARLKKDFTGIPDALEMVKQINGYYFFWNTGIDKARQVGFSAQEMQEVIPEVVSIGEDDYLSIDYGKMTPLLLEAIKELSAQVEELKREVAALKK